MSASGAGSTPMIAGGARLSPLGERGQQTQQQRSAVLLIAALDQV